MTGGEGILLGSGGSLRGVRLDLCLRSLAGSDDRDKSLDRGVPRVVRFSGMDSGSGAGITNEEGVLVASGDRL